MSTALIVLVVEDEPLIALMLMDWLEELKFEPRKAHDIGSALDAIRERRPDFAIVDFYLHAIPACEVLDELFRLNVPTLLATAADPDEIEKAYVHVPTLRKPYLQEEVAAVLVEFSNELNRQQSKAVMG